MKKIIKQALDDMRDSQINLSSDAARETVATLISTALKSEYSFTKHNKNVTDDEIEASWVCTICDESTFDVEYDYLGSGTNHLSCELEMEQEKELKHFADGFHEGVWERDMESIGKDELVNNINKEVESMKLAEAIVDDLKEGEYIYESDDGGKTIYKRKFGDYKNKEQVELDFKNKKEKGN